MKKILEFIKHNVLGFITGAVIFGSFGVYAATVIAASNVGYSDNTSLGADNVQDAIDKLNAKATTKIKEAEAKCPKGYDCTKSKLCKRATTLHTETCSTEDKSGYCQADGYALNDTITYGNLGTKGTLTSGDAFDCDVNGDGVYDSATERFYYVSDMTNGVTQDSNTAVLIYYNNVSGGVASNSTAYAYDESGSNNNGPVTALAQLPTTSQWKNVSLINTARDITDEKNTVRKSAFSYAGYAARLITAQEVSAGCGFTVRNNYTTGELSSKCKYLMENTQYSSSSLKTYGGWLESPCASSSRSAWYVLASGRFVYSFFSVDYPGGSGVRPAIEVLKSNISY